MILSGGQSYKEQLVEYDTLNDAFIDYGEEFVSSALGNSDGENGWGVYFTQINATTLYTINRNGDSINVYDLQSLSFYDLGTTIPVDVSYHGCIASAITPSPRLYITGGKVDDWSSPNWLEELDDLQILGLDDLQWLTSAPSMTTARAGHGCIVVNDLLWAIGGQSSESVEMINITDITTGSWQVVGSVSCQMSSFGITAVDDIIFLVGGYCWDTSARSGIVYTIDTVTNTISVYAESLPFPVNGMSILAIDDMIYGFGGTNGSSLDSWMTLDLLSLLKCTYSKTLLVFLLTLGMFVS